MRRGSLIAGLVSGLVCVACVASYSFLVRGEADAARAEALQRYGGEQVEVLVATQDIVPGESLSAANTATRTWISDLLPDESISSLSEVRGQQVTSLVIKGEALSLRRFEAAGTRLEVPQGCVALSVPAKDVQTVGGSLVPGSVVDVYAVGVQTTRIGANILVLATNVDATEGSKAQVSWVTLAVPLSQSQEFVTASQSMDIYFTLPAPSEGGQE